MPPALEMDVAARVVRVPLVAAFDTTNSGLNFNGAAHGGRTLLVPLGWRVTVDVHNADRGLTHSALVTLPALPPPPVPGEAAFAGAATRDARRGLRESKSSAFSFAADRPGDFHIVCGVTGHAMTGMWIRMRVMKGGIPRWAGGAGSE